MHLWCSGMYNNRIIVRRVCQCKNLKNQSVIGEDIDKNKVPHFWLTVYLFTMC